MALREFTNLVENKMARAPRIFDFHLIGGSSADPKTRFVNADPATWKWEIPDKSWGADALWLHNPFGSSPDQLMRIDQLVQAEQQNCHWLAAGFVEAFKNLSIPLVYYIGCADPPDGFAAPISDPTVAAIIDASLAPARVLQSQIANCKSQIIIGLDNANAQEFDSNTRRLLERLDLEGIATISESWPLVSEPWQWQRDWCVSFTQYQQVNWGKGLKPGDAAYGSVDWAADRKVLTGECVVLMDAGGAWNERNQFLFQCRASLKEGDSIAVNVANLQRLQLKKSDLFP